MTGLNWANSMKGSTADLNCGQLEANLKPPWDRSDGLNWANSMKGSTTGLTWANSIKGRTAGRNQVEAALGQERWGLTGPIL